MAESISELSRRLGIARSSVAERVRNGMPRTSVEAAIEWSRRNLDPAKAKPAPPQAPRIPFAALQTDALADWAGARLPLLEALATLSETELASTSIEQELWENILGDFVTSDGAWRKIVAHVLDLAADDAGAA